MATVIALIHGDAPDYGISFPDIPGCVGGGDTIESCLASGRAAAELHLDAMARDGEPMPDFRDLAAIKADPRFAEDFADATIVTAVAVALPGRSVRLNISLDNNLLRRIDRAAERAGQTRSAFIAAAARERLNEEA